MSDEEFLALKNQIKEYIVMCHDVNQSSLALKKDILELDEYLSQLQYDIHKLQSELDILEVF